MQRHHGAKGFPTITKTFLGERFSDNAFYTIRFRKQAIFRTPHGVAMNAPIHLPQDLWKVGVRASDVPVVPGSTPNPLAVDEFETFDDDARLEREIGERFPEDYFEMDF